MTSHVDSIDSLGKGVASLDTTTFADSAERVIAGMEESQEITLEGPFDDTATTGPDAVFGAIVGTIGTVEFYPHGTASGDRKMSGEFLCTTYQVQAPVKERVSYSATFKLDGTLAVTTV
jgi:hypothetical protein